MSIFLYNLFELSMGGIKDGQDAIVKREKNKNSDEMEMGF